MDPATNRGFPGVEHSSAACRASVAARLFNSCASAASPYSASTSGVPPKLLVSTMSDPASKYFRWMSSTTSGLVRTRFSLQPSSAAPPKSAAVKDRCCSIVPIAPSNTRMRCPSSSRSALSDSFRFLMQPFFLELLVTLWPYKDFSSFLLSPLFYVALLPESTPLPVTRNPLQNKSNLSVTVREHLSPRPLPLRRPFTTLKYSGY